MVWIWTEWSFSVALISHLKGNNSTCIDVARYLQTTSRWSCCLLALAFSTFLFHSVSELMIITIINTVLKQDSLDIFNISPHKIRAQNFNERQSNKTLWPALTKITYSRTFQFFHYKHRCCGKHTMNQTFHFRELQFSSWNNKRIAPVWLPISGNGKILKSSL